MSGRASELTRLLHLSADYIDPNEGRDHITGLDHALRCAQLGTRVSAEMSLVGLVHDLARPLSDAHHGEVIAEIVRDRVSDHAYHVLRSHGTYQASAVHGTTRPNGGPWQKAALQLAAFEAASFRPTCPAMGLGDAEDLLAAWLT